MNPTASAAFHGVLLESLSSERSEPAVKFLLFRANLHFFGFLCSSLGHDLSSPPLSSTMRTLEETERSQIHKTLSETRWRINGKDGTAAILGLHPSTLRARMDNLGVVRPETKEPD